MAAFRKSMSTLLILSMFIVSFAAMTVNAFAADEITVNIVSFTRGEQEDLRSSELLEARVTGYDGNVRELTYKWTNTLGTYLYVYNSHNMYGINNTDGEIEIYNDDVSASANMSGRSYKDSYTGVGFAWAAVYGANLSNSDLVGTVTVEVYDADGNLLATDSHTGTRVKTGGYWWWETYEYHGFVESDLSGDVQNIAFGMFEGDTKNVKILLGESSIVHITCAECTVSEATVVSGEDLIEVVFDNDSGEYHIKSVTGVVDGVAEVQVSIEKGNCKFHQNYTATRTIKVYVYNKPTTTSTATAIMLDNLDDNCTYYIGGVAGVRELDDDGNEIVIFENLTPNTQYQVEVVGQADNTEPVYAYVYETTKPAHVGTVEVILNGTYDTSTGTASGERVDITEVMPDADTLYLRYEDSEIYFPLEKTATGVYSTELSDGTYHIYYDDNSSAKLSDQELTISGASRTRELFFNSVTYDVNGGTPAISTEYYFVESAVTVSSTVPEKEGYLFTGWQDEDGNTYSADATLTDAIGEAYTLTAQYVVSADVYVNILIRHVADDGVSHNNESDMHDITFTVDSRYAGEHDYTELVSKSVEWDGEDAYSGSDFNVDYINQNGQEITRYIAAEPTLANVEKAKEYTVTTVKSGYDLISVTSEEDENGDIILTAELVFNPNDFDFEFTVTLDEQSKLVADELKPAAVNVKVICYGDTPYDEDYGLPENDNTVAWYTITQHRETYERIALDADGKGSGTYPVWMVATDTQEPYYYRIEVVSYETADGTILPAIDKNDEHITYATEQNRYSAEIVVTDGAAPSGTTLDGAWYENGAQNGDIKAVVTIDVFDVTFVPNGGTLNGSTDNTVLNYQIGIPDLSAYVPTRDGGYVFDGWYLADENGNITDEAAVSDTIIFENKTLIAKWREPLTVGGSVAVAGTYENDNGAETDIYDHDRLASVTVLLQQIDANGYAETVKSAEVPVTYSGKYGIGTYEFAEIADNGHDFRIKVVSANYHTHYQNETSTAAEDDYDSYTEDMYMAEFSDDTEANVNVYLHFAPENFELEYEVDATALGEGYRPSNAEVLVLCDTGEHLDPQHWEVISQMVSGDGYTGNATALENGKGCGSEPVWTIKPDGVTPYDYSIRVDSLTFGGAETQYGDSLPYAIYYNGSARYSDLSDAQTQMLTATVVPRMYTVTFDMGILKEVTDITITNMDAYATMHQTFEDTYYWSYGKAVTASPAAEGYTFLGWLDEDGNKVTSIAASSAENITLYANWIIDVEFETLADAGYYSAARDSAEKAGVIAFNARITNFADVKSRIASYGMYLYDASSTLMVTVTGGDIAQLEADNGEFHALVTNIAPENFSGNVLAAPFVVVDGEIIMGESMTMSVSATNKWLGPKS